MEDINEEEVDELVCPKHGYWGEGGDGVRLGQRQQCGDDKREQVPWEQVPLWCVMIWLIQQAFPYIIFSLKVMAFLRYFPIIDMFPFGHVPLR